MLQKKEKVMSSELDFYALSKKEKKPRVRIRFLGLAHVKEGKAYPKVAEMMKVSCSTVQNWVNKFVDEGIEELKDKNVGGKKPFFPKDREEELRDLIVELQSEMKGGRLIGADIKKIVKDKFDVELCLSSIYELLARINMVCVSSRSRHPKSDPKAQESFKKNFKKKSYGDVTKRC